MTLLTLSRGFTLSDKNPDVTSITDPWKGHISKALANDMLKVLGLVNIPTINTLWTRP